MMVRKEVCQALKKTWFWLFYGLSRFSDNTLPIYSSPGLSRAAVGFIISRLSCVRFLFGFLLTLIISVSEAQSTYEPVSYYPPSVVSFQNPPLLKSLSYRSELAHLSRLPVLVSGSSLLGQFDEKAPEKSLSWEPDLYEGVKKIEGVAEDERYRQELEKELEDRVNLIASTRQDDVLELSAAPEYPVNEQQGQSSSSSSPSDADNGVDEEKKQSGEGSSQGGEPDNVDSSNSSEQSTVQGDLASQPVRVEFIVVAGNFQEASFYVNSESRSVEAVKQTSQLSEGLFGDPPSLYYANSSHKCITH